MYQANPGYDQEKDLGTGQSASGNFFWSLFTLIELGEFSKENLREILLRLTWLAASKNYLEIPLVTRNGPEHKESVPYNK